MRSNYQQPLTDCSNVPTTFSTYKGPSQQQQRQHTMTVRRSAASQQHEPWWEIQARQWIASGDIQSLGTVFRYHLYGPKDALLAALRQCTKERLNKICALLSHPEMRPDPMQPVEGITNLVEADFRCPFPTSYGWEPRRIGNLDAERIANAINDRSIELLSHIEFQDCVRYALGYTQPSVDHVIIQHRIIAFTTRCYLGEHPGMTETYKEVEQILQHRNALAHQAVLNGLLPENEPYIGVELICKPIIQLFKDAKKVGALLEALPILQEHFERVYR